MSKSRHARAVRRRVGFNLLEVILGTFIFVITFASLAAGWVIQERAAKKYRDRNAAMVFARNEIENAVAVGFPDLETYVATANASDEITIERSVDGLPTTRTFRRQLQVSPGSSADIKDLVVAITYRDDRDEERKVELETSIFYSAR